MLTRALSIGGCPGNRNAVLSSRANSLRGMEGSRATFSQEVQPKGPILGGPRRPNSLRPPGGSALLHDRWGRGLKYNLVMGGAEARELSLNHTVLLGGEGL